MSGPADCHSSPNPKPPGSKSPGSKFTGGKQGAIGTGSAQAPRSALSSRSAAGHYVALVGAPNIGKSTLFNQLTGLRQKVANFPGVTVEYHLGTCRLESGRQVTLIDLPGVYSLDALSEDERVTRDVLRGQKAELGQPDAILLLLDATNLQRHLLLAAPVLALGLPTLVILNLADELTGRGGSVDADALSRELGVPVKLVSAVTGQGLGEVRHFLEALSSQELAAASSSAPTAPSPPTAASGQPSASAPANQAARELPVLESLPQRYAWAGKLGASAGYRPPAPPEWTARLDRIFLHPLFGPLIFLVIVALLFQSIFTWATPIMDAMEASVLAIGQWLAPLLPEGWLRSLVIDGAWAGVGSVVVFLPQILLLFLFIGILEDSGYLARAALIADRTMRKAGLQGKAFIPLLSAYACAVPAIMGARTIESQRDRWATIFIAPFMTCSARLPVYTLLIAAFVPDTPLLGSLFGARAAAMLGLYALGFLAALLTAKLLGSTVFKPTPNSFVMELPPYRRPSLVSLGIRLLERGRIFLTRAGTVILAVSLGLWLLASFPLVDGKPPAIADSYAGQIGRAMEPAIKPLGFNWKIGIGLITSLAAREVIVGTLGTIYGIENAEETPGGLEAALQADLTPGGAYALLVFFAFALQCFSTVAIVRRETGSWKFPLAQFGYMLFLGFGGAFLVNQAWLWCFQK